LCPATGSSSSRARASLRALFGVVEHLGATRPHGGTIQAFGMEIVLTWLLVTVILGTATRYQLIGTNAAIPVGAAIALDGLFALPVSGASMNPAVSFGPSALGGALDTVWIYLVAPPLGAVLAVIVTWLLHGRPKAGEEQAAAGEAGKQARSTESAH
jgi:glycerol uptake facilitator-like aquaporin